MASDQKVLVAYDGSEGANAAIDAAVRLFGDRRLIVLSVGRSLASVASASVVAVPAEVAGEALAQLDEATQQESETLAETGARIARDQGLEATAIGILSTGSAWATIIRTAEENDVAVIIVGSRGRSNVKSILLGSVSGAVVHHSVRPVLVVSGPSVDATELRSEL